MAANEQHSRNSIKPPPRSGHVAATEGNVMFVWGGFNEYGEPYLPQERYLPGSNVWMYHALIDCWYSKKTTGDIPPGTSGASAIILENCLYVVAGHTAAGNTNQVYRLDLQQWHWSCLDTGTDSRQQMSPRDKFVVWEHKNRIHVFGGFGVPVNDYLSDHGEFCLDVSTWSPIRGWNNQLLVLDPAQGTWTNPVASGPAPSPRAAHTAVCLLNKVFIFGGRHNHVRLNDLHCLDMDLLRWSGELATPGETPSGRSWHSLTAVSATHAVLYGGYTQDGLPLSDGWLLDAHSLQWTRLEVAENRPRLWHTAGSSDDGDVLIFGGCTNNILGEEDTEHTNELIVLRCTVKSLLRLSLDAAYKHHDVLSTDWHSLPKHLYHMLQLRLQGPEDDDDSDLSHNTKACTVS